MDSGNNETNIGRTENNDCALEHNNFKRKEFSKFKKKHKKKKSSCKSHKRSHSISSSSSETMHKRKKSKKREKLKQKQLSDIKDDMPGPPAPKDIPQKSVLMKPMTKEEWERKQNIMRHVIDPLTGRKRLIKGDGEVLEEIVTKDRHQIINKQATACDGTYFQKITQNM